MEIHIEEEARSKRLLRGSFAVLREAVIGGEVERAKVPALTGYEERGARNVTAALVERGMLTASSHRAPLRLAFRPMSLSAGFPTSILPTPDRDHDGQGRRTHSALCANGPTRRDWDFLLPASNRPLRWHEMEDEHRVLILADPGAGKTFEACRRTRLSSADRV
jgi:hypothetical protein